ncbi:MAG: hypothetical protein L6R42_005511 [Xanthoria sp. 1 TBL-2021]|nr:MAG: hypothetical protein L6R42_005511 [Xanthoria sp. 1 TBL-2021]
MKERPKVIPIILFHESVDTFTSAWARIDESMPISLLSFQILDELRLPHEPCDKTQVENDKGRLYNAVGKIDLKWVVWNIARDYSDTFYVVECEKPMVRLGASTIKDDFVAVKQGGCFPMALDKPSPEKKKQLAKKSEQHEIEQATEAELQRGIAVRERELKRDYEETGICPTCGNRKST